MEFDESRIMKQTKSSKMSKEADHKQRMTLHCRHCNTVLGDSHGICGEIKCLDSILCLRVTDDVVVSASMELGQKGEMAKCIYSSLECRVCCSAVGKVIHSAPSRLAMVRSLFLLNKANISCYIFKRSLMVKASTLTFDVKPLKESMDMMKLQFEVQLEEMTRIKIRLAETSVTSKLVKK
ncbi:protein Mis18-beta [Centropristis striata]|uniref:protein Mis18-beta n=1 Tax=Centropristis striata TaxID=184440 RepID=UPI0027E075C0|nr:protein Mis18-beta [Centropristis striata]